MTISRVVMVIIIFLFLWADSDPFTAWLFAQSLGSEQVTPSLNLKQVEEESRALKERLERIQEKLKPLEAPPLPSEPPPRRTPAARSEPPETMRSPIIAPPPIYMPSNRGADPQTAQGLFGRGWQR